MNDTRLQRKGPSYWFMEVVGGGVLHAVKLITRDIRQMNVAVHDLGTLNADIFFDRETKSLRFHSARRCEEDKQKSAFDGYSRRSRQTSTTSDFEQKMPKSLPAMVVLTCVNNSDRNILTMDHDD